MQDSANSARFEITPGSTLYDEDGHPVGRVIGSTDEGFEVESLDPDEDVDDQEEIPGHGFGEGYLMWRCGECGEMGELEDGMPAECPNCGAPREDISEVRED